MPYSFAPETRQLLLVQLQDALEASTMQELRQAARAWGWPLRGTAKADVVAQMLGYLSDPEHMAQAVYGGALPPEARAILAWLSTLNPPGDPKKMLQQVLALANGQQMTQKAVAQQIIDLQERHLLFMHGAGTPEEQLFVPRIFLEWLPQVEAPNLLYAGEPQTVSQFTLATFNQHLQHLLTNIEADRPVMAANAAPAPGMYAPAPAIAKARPGPVPEELLARWGYRTPEERSLAGFLLEQLIQAGLVSIDWQGNQRRLAPTPPAIQAWETLTAADRLTQLKMHWLEVRPMGAQQQASWTELDFALRGIEDYTLRSTYYWNLADQTHNVITKFLRPWLYSVILGLAWDVWHSIERLCELAYHAHRDLLAWDRAGTTWRWHRDKAALDPQSMTFDVWRETYGRIVEAWLSGPMRWLLMAQIGYQAGKPVAFRIMSQPPVGDAEVPAGALRFAPGGTAVLHNTWQTGGLRRLLRAIAMETARNRESTTYRIDTATFRNALESGASAAEIIELFASAGFPLPAETADTLRRWQARAGVYQLYDHVAVIEFSEEIHPEEIRAILAQANAGERGAGQYYQASPRCLVALNPDTIQNTIYEFRRRGYTPQVVRDQKDAVK